jgi:SAM-dependent methyltransferase
MAGLRPTIMNRQPEPELMLASDQAAAYAAADFSEPHNHFVQLCREHHPPSELSGWVLDLGCGPGDITFRFGRAFPQTRLLAVDGSPAMLALGRRALEQAPDLRNRIEFKETFLPADLIPDRSYAAIISNSLLHHLRQPEVLWQTVRQHAQPGTFIWIMDLCRPANLAQARELMEAHAAGAPAVLRHDFYHSLLAAFEPVEVEEQLREANLSELKVQKVSNRHLFIQGIKQ